MLHMPVEVQELQHAEHLHFDALLLRLSDRVHLQPYSLRQDLETSDPDISRLHQSPVSLVMCCPLPLKVCTGFRNGCKLDTAFTFISFKHDSICFYP